MLKSMGKKIFTILAENFCLSKPMVGPFYKDFVLYNVSVCFQIQNRSELSLTDLVKICVHVARGCKYLEDMHFVHR